ncbi:MAG TPA: DNA internalization-related competence protein ComEC/Rec2 [Eubacteriaceae bacterium]|nr:DNA internalization-related competence protein ComEC/Rec2 [Eubacteriaceae bacterium]
MNRPILYAFVLAILVMVACESAGWQMGLSVVAGLVLSLLLRQASLVQIAAIVVVPLFLIGAWIVQAENPRVPIDETKAVEGEICDFPLVKNGSGQMTARIDSLQEKVRVIVFLEEGESFPYEYGQRLVLHSPLTIPDGKRNPGGFDYRRYLKGSGIRYVSYAQGEQIEVVPVQPSPSMVDRLVAFRSRIIEILQEGGSRETFAFSKAILFGEKSMEESKREIYTKSGIAHLLAVSGMHVGFLYALLIFGIGKLNIKGLSRWLILALILSTYAFLCGCSASVVRAVGVAVLREASILLNKPMDSVHALSLVGLVNLCVMPYAVFQESFILSYGASFAIVIFYAVFSRKISFQRKYGDKIFKTFLLSLVIQAALFPVMSILFQGVSWIGPLVNILAVPLVGLTMLVLILAVLCVPFFSTGSRLFFFAADVCVKTLEWLAENISQQSFFYWNVASMQMGEVLLFYLICFLAAGYFTIRWMKWVKLSIGVILLFSLVYPFRPDLKITMLDVGQGDSMLIEYKSQMYVIDGGGHYRKNMGEEVVKKAVYSKGRTRVDGIFVTHGHEDHVKGIEEALQYIKPREIYISAVEVEGFEKIRQYVREANVRLYEMKAYDKIQLDGQTSFTVLSPFLEDGYTNSNSASLVGLFECGDFRMLTTGDMESKDEEKILSKKNLSEVAVLKVAHHGSNSSTSEEWLQACRPKLALISVGQNNPFSHPAQETVANLENIGAGVFRTDLHGAIEITVNRRELSLFHYVEEQDK